MITQNIAQSANLQTPQREDALIKSCHIIVFGNEKGGSGKSTGAMHTAIALLRQGYQVGTIDLDARQGTMTRYMRNRFQFITRTHKTIPSPLHMAIERSKARHLDDQEREEQEFLAMALDELKPLCDFIVIDTPGTDSHLSRLAHGQADTLVTPVNDSFIDLDLLADIDPDSHIIQGSSVYARMVADIRKDKKMRWIVMSNRLSHINAKNKEDIGSILDKIGKSQDCSIVPGLAERVIFRELFLKGLTLMDLEDDPDNSLTLSQVAARQEVRNLVHAIAPEKSGL
jgi:chromosome partitioning protein